MLYVIGFLIIGAFGFGILFNVFLVIDVAKDTKKSLDKYQKNKEFNEQQEIKIKSKLTDSEYEKYINAKVLTGRVNFIMALITFLIITLFVAGLIGVFLDSLVLLFICIAVVIPLLIIGVKFMSSKFYNNYMEKNKYVREVIQIVRKE